MGSSKDSAKVLNIEVPEAPILEDVGTNAQEKAVEDLIKIPINEDRSRYFLVGSSLSKDEREELVTFLKRNVEVFAWSPHDMLGIDPKFICHELNVDDKRRPVIQKPRRSSLQHADVVAKEVDRLLAANAIQEVQYPKWLANTVVVPKKGGSGAYASIIPISMTHVRRTVSQCLA